MWAVSATLRPKLKAFEGFDDLLGHTMSWYIDELERRMEELATFGVHKTDQDMADLLRAAAGRKDPRYQLAVHSLVYRVA